jgi:hypothetical protein
MDNIVHLFGPPPAVEGAPEKGPSDYTCYPHSPFIDRTSRVVRCKRCKTQLDPVDVLLQVADQHQDYVRMLEDTRTLRRDLEQMRIEEKKLKQRMQSHSRKDVGVAVAAEREKLLKQYSEVVTRAREIAHAGKRIEELITGKRR